MNASISGNRSLFYLSKYNRKIGLPTILGVSMAASIFFGSAVYLNFKIAGTFLGIIAAGLLFFLSANTFLMLANFLVMNYLFNKVLEDFDRKGIPYASLTGIESLGDLSIKETRYAAILFISSTASLIMYLLGTISLEIIFIYVTMGLTLMTFGFSIIKRRHIFDPEEMLRLYEPDIFPAIMGTDIFLQTFIDPFNRLRFDEYKKELSEYLKEGLSTGDALSKISLLLYHNMHGAIGYEDLHREISDLVKKEEYVTALECHQEFSFDRLKIILTKTKRLIPEFTRLLDRLFINVLDNLPILRSSNVFIDAEASWEKRRGEICKVFILLYNNQPEKGKVLTVNYSAAAFGPSSAEVTVALPPRDFDLPDEDKLPVYSQTGQDVMGLTSRIMDNARVIWFSFEVKENGVKPVTVTVKDKETGQTLFGETFLVEVSYDLPGLIIRSLGLISVFFGVFLPLARLMGIKI